LFWPFLISRFSSTLVYSTIGATFDFHRRRRAGHDYKNPQIEHTALASAHLAPSRTLARTPVRVFECQSVVLSSRRNIRLSFVPGHPSRAALSAIAFNVTCRP
jgi:hypothetical protein